MATIDTRHMAVGGESRTYSANREGKKGRGEEKTRGREEAGQGCRTGAEDFRVSRGRSECDIKLTSRGSSFCTIFSLHVDVNRKIY